MKKFQFSLKALLSYREHLERIARQEVAKVQAEINTCTDLIREFKESRTLTETGLEKRAEEGISAKELIFYTDYLKGLGLKLEAEQTLLENLKNLLRKKQAELVAKSVRKKMIENLKEKQKKTYYEAIEKLIQKESDEMVLLSRQSLEEARGVTDGQEE